MIENLCVFGPRLKPKTRVLKRLAEDLGVPYITDGALILNRSSVIPVFQGFRNANAKLMALLEFQNRPYFFIDHA